MNSFISHINESFDHLTFPIWHSLCSRLSLSVSPERPDFSNDRFIDEFSSIVCDFDMNSPQSGIISYLTKQYGGNVIDRNIVSITASPLYHPQVYDFSSCCDSFWNSLAEIARNHVLAFWQRIKEHKLVPVLKQFGRFCLASRAFN
jgi:hypothetical protein